MSADNNPLTFFLLCHEVWSLFHKNDLYYYFSEKSVFLLLSNPQFNPKNVMRLFLSP
jgi:hypothetical protein